jgi:tetratricopeptide (TPR) repeat protein
LAWTRKQWRQEHFNIVPAIVDLAQVLAEKTEFAEAERLYRQAILIRQKGLGRDHPATTEIQMQLARVLFDAGRREEAILLGRETLASRQTRLGSDHPRVALSALDFAAMSSESGDHAGAEKLAREAYAVLRKGLGDAHPDTTAAMVGLAEILLRKGDAAAAHDVLREGRSGLQKLLPARSWRLALVDSLLGGCLVACKPARFSEAEPPLLTGHKTLLAAFGPSDPRTKQAAARIVALYEAWGKPDQAAKYRAAGAK